MRLTRLIPRVIPRAIALAAAALLTTAATPAPRGNWLTTVSATASGSHVMGNPAAPVKLVEYVSYTCSHCAHFQEQSEVAMRLGYIQPGKVQLEVRNLVRDPIDMTAALLTRCGGPARFFANHNLFLRSQDRWIDRLGSASDAQKARWTSGAFATRTRAIAADFGFYAMMEARGYNRPQLNRCLADEAMAKRLAAQGEEAGKLGVRGTPSFLLNDVLLAGTHDWQSLYAQLQARF